jgi:hypothetical protein
LGNKHEHKDRRAEHRAIDATERSERQLIDMMALSLPCLAESDMCDVDAEPCLQKFVSARSARKLANTRLTKMVLRPLNANSQSKMVVPMSGAVWQ